MCDNYCGWENNAKRLLQKSRIHFVNAIQVPQFRFQWRDLVNVKGNYKFSKTTGDSVRLKLHQIPLFHGVS
jgi:hypothetical protein